MHADPAALAILGLTPGADRVAIDRAYRDLMKRHHPDMPGGDAARAAEVNRAYREIIAPARRRGDIALYDDVYRRSGIGWSGVAWLAATAGLVAVFVGLLSPGSPLHLAARPIAAAIEDGAPTLLAAPLANDVLDQPLSLPDVDSAILEAVTTIHTQDEAALVTASRACHEQLQVRPALSAFDRCAAFDDTVLRLLEVDPMRSTGNFNQLAVTGRQLSSAYALSGDRVAAEGRLRRIRLRIDMMLAPPEGAGR